MSAHGPNRGEPARLRAPAASITQAKGTRTRKAVGTIATPAGGHNGNLRLVWLVVMPANHGASTHRFEVAGGAHSPRLAISPRQGKETQDRSLARGTHRANEVRIVATQRVRSRACVPPRVRRVSSPWSGQMCQHVLHLLPQRPVKASRSLECSDEL